MIPCSVSFVQSTILSSNSFDNVKSTSLYAQSDIANAAKDIETNGVLETLGAWLRPINGSLPNLTLRNEIINLVQLVRDLSSFFLLFHTSLSTSYTFNHLFALSFCLSFSFYQLILMPLTRY